MNGCKNNIEGKNEDPIKAILALSRSIEDLTRKLTHIQGAIERLAARM
jgi:hypothetical protein